MFKNKATVSILLFASCFNAYNYPMEGQGNPMEWEESEDEWYEAECDEPEKPAPSPRYLKEAHSKLIDSIKQGDLNGFKQIIEELGQNVISKEMKELLTTRNEQNGDTLLDAAESLSEYRPRDFILKKLQIHGVPTLISDNNFEVHQQDSHNRFLTKHKNLMDSIETGIIEVVKESLTHAYNDFASIVFAESNRKKKAPITNNFQIIVLLNEPDSTSGHTPLTLAIEKEFLDIAELLLVNGANHFTANKNGMKPEDIAFQRLGISKDEFFKMFNIKKTMREISEEYVRSPQYLKLEQEAEEYKKKRAVKGKSINKYLKN